jgi:hypothetical protein
MPVFSKRTPSPLAKPEYSLGAILCPKRGSGNKKKLIAETTDGHLGHLKSTSYQLNFYAKCKKRCPRCPRG